MSRCGVERGAWQTLMDWYLDNDCILTIDKSQDPAARLKYKGLEYVGYADEEFAQKASIWLAARRMMEIMK